MTQLLDAEGYEIPSEKHGPFFDADLCDWGEGKGPELTINIPQYFEGDFGEYWGCGTLVVAVQDVLNDYLDEFEETDGGDHVAEFAEWLHKYADRLMLRLAVTQRPAPPASASSPLAHAD